MSVVGIGGENSKATGSNMIFIKMQVQLIDEGGHNSRQTRPHPALLASYCICICVHHKGLGVATELTVDCPCSTEFIMDQLYKNGNEITILQREKSHQIHSRVTQHQCGEGRAVICLGVNCSCPSRKHHLKTRGSTAKAHQKGAERDVISWHLLLGIRIHIA